MLSPLTLEFEVEGWPWFLVVTAASSLNRSPYRTCYYSPKLLKRFGDALEIFSVCRISIFPRDRLWMFGWSFTLSLPNLSYADSMLRLMYYMRSRSPVVKLSSKGPQSELEWFVWGPVIEKIQLVSLISSPKAQCSKYHQNIFKIMGIRYRSPRLRKGIWCKWDTPDPGWIKLNFDGSARDGCMTGGGMIRDDEGRFILILYIFWGKL